MTDYKKLIEAATRRRCVDHVPRIFMELQEADRQERSFNQGTSVPNELLEKAIEAMLLVDRFGYGVNVEKNLVIRNTATVMEEALAEIKQRLEEGL